MAIKKLANKQKYRKVHHPNVLLLHYCNITQFLTLIETVTKKRYWKKELYFIF